MKKVRILFYFSLDFKESITESYETYDGSYVDVPTHWQNVPENGYGNDTGIFQNSDSCDTSEQKLPSFILKKNKILKHGSLTTSVIPPHSCAEGIISVIIKHNLRVGQEGGKNLSYYMFEMINSPSSGNSFRLRKYSDGIVKDIKVITNKSELHNIPFELGFTPDLEHKVVVTTSGTKIKILLSVNKSKFVKIFKINDADILEGGIGIGTCKCKARFTEFKMRPPITTLTEEEKRVIINESSEEIVSGKGEWEEENKENKRKKTSSSNGESESESEGGKSSGGKSTNEQRESHEEESSVEIKATDDGGYEVRGWSENETHTKQTSSNVKKFSKDFVSGWETCIVTKTSDDRKDYCDKIKSDPLRDNCHADFCSTCCESNISSTRVNVIHQCVKLCYQSSASKTDVKSSDQCLNSVTNQNVYTYCENSMSGKPFDFINKCKLDMCNLCCATIDAQLGLKTSARSEKSCFSACSFRFNIEEGGINGGGGSSGGNSSNGSC